MVYRRSAVGQSRLNEQRASIRAAAAELLAEGGYAACSIVAVAARAEVATGTVYRHFDGKPALFTELFEELVGREVAAVRAAVDHARDPRAQITALVQTFAGRAFRSPVLAYALLAEPVEADIDRLRSQFRTAFRDLIAGIIEAGISTGELPPQLPTAIGAAVVGAIAEALVGPLSSSSAAGSDEAIRELTTFVLRGLGVGDVAHA